MIILGRHGNTFTNAEGAVWVGSRTDLPLVPEGLRQAERVADYLSENGFHPSRIVAAPLQRTRTFAEIVAGRFGLNTKIDDRLVELDYGLWEGLDRTEISDRFGEQEIDAWEENLHWPVASGWGESQHSVQERVRSFLEELEKDARAKQVVFAVTSNGILRYIRYLLTGERASTVTKVRTGALCILGSAHGNLEVRIWNFDPGK